MTADSRTFVKPGTDLITYEAHRLIRKLRKGKDLNAWDEDIVAACLGFAHGEVEREVAEIQINRAKAHRKAWVQKHHIDKRETTT